MLYFSRLYILVTDCFYNFTSYNDVFMTPNYPANYENDQVCVYAIYQPENTRIHLIIEDFDMEEAPGDCTYDYLMVSTRWQNTK